jgi:hypothetical protein
MAWSLFKIYIVFIFLRCFHPHPRCIALLAQKAKRERERELLDQPSLWTRLALEQLCSMKTPLSFLCAIGIESGWDQVFKKNRRNLTAVIRLRGQLWFPQLVTYHMVLCETCMLWMLRCFCLRSYKNIVLLSAK